MSTRSGKRIHKSLHENIASTNEQEQCKTDRKTRSRRLKENCDILNISLPKTKKRHNYVSYPSEEDDVNGTASKITETNHVRPLKKTALKELNVDVNEVTNCTESQSNIQHNQNVRRQTRRTKKFTETTDEENIQNSGTIPETVENDTAVVTKKKKNPKKKQLKKSEDVVENDTDVRPVPLKTSRRKKKGEKCSNSLVVEDVFQTAIKDKQKLLNNTNTSIESFHSAAGSPTSSNVFMSLNGTLTKSSASKNLPTKLDSTLEKVVDKLSVSCYDDKSAEKPSKKRRSSRLSQVKINFDIDEELPATAAVEDTYEAPQTDKQVNSTFDKVPKSPKKSLRISQSNLGAKDSTFDKDDNTKTINTTFDKPQDNKTLDSPKLNTTFEKDPAVPDCRSTISSDSDLTVNVTFDKSNDDISRISINSDDSKQSTENILNTTPVLIESSIDSSNITETSPEPLKPAFAPAPLKREGTFTKDGPDPILVEKKTTNCNTPTKQRMSLQSPGCTPFHSNSAKVPREKSVMNVTRSIEKPTRLSLFSETIKTSKVMFCSPVNNPIMNTQRKGKVIKSSMKGSNKSFLFEDREATMQLSSRKRSYTQSDADESRVKRKRLADDLQQSVDRLSRPRTSSAQAKPTETTPAKKPPTPRAKSESKARKLPNFAALHQKQFQKMESLDECQDRKAKRAKQLLVPTGSLAVLDRSSPKSSTANTSAKEAETKKPPPAPPKTDPKKGYTRFGYKLNLDVNPFSIPSKHPAKEVNIAREPKKSTLAEGPKKVSKIPLNGGMTRLPTLPSLSGVTQARKDMAKKVIMREKSASSLKELGNMKRNENRTIIKGVRTNRRFELQMKTRNIHG